MANFPIFADYDKKQNTAFVSTNVVNLFLINSPHGKKKLAYVAAPGLSLEETVLEGFYPARELFILGSNMFGVFGSSVYRFGANLVPTLIGTINTSVGFVSIQANNAHQIGFFDQVNGWCYDTIANTFTQITATGFPPRPASAGFLDGYMIVPSLESVEFQFSAFNDIKKWSALDDALLQSYQGTNIGVGIVNKRIFFFKTASTEVWYNAGNADIPFRPDQNLVFNYGALCTSSIRSAFGYLFWLSNDDDGVGSVMMTTGGTPERISNDSIDDLIASFTAPFDMDAYIYKDKGRIFYEMSWTTDDVTLYYDLKMQAWYTKKMLQHIAVPGQPYSAKTRHLSSCHAYFNGEHIVGSYKDGKIYSMSQDYIDNAGEPFAMEFVTQNVFDPENYNMQQINKIELDMESGLGVSGDGEGVFADPNDDPLINPQVYLALSRDGGLTYGNELPAPIGKIGKTRTRTIWRKKGQARDIVGKFKIYTPLKNVAILGASIDLKVLNK